MGEGSVSSKVWVRDDVGYGDVNQNYKVLYDVHKSVLQY